MQVNSSFLSCPNVVIYLLVAIQLTGSFQVNHIYALDVGVFGLYNY